MPTRHTELLSADAGAVAQIKGYGVDARAGGVTLASASAVLLVAALAAWVRRRRWT